MARAAPPSARSMPQVTSSPRARTSTRSSRSSGSSLATRRDSSLRPLSSIATQWWWVFPASMPAQIMAMWCLRAVCCRCLPTDDLAVDSLLSDHSQFLIGSRVVVGYWAANQWKPQAAEPFEPHPAPLGGSTIRGAHHIPQNNVGSLFSLTLQPARAGIAAGGDPTFL